MINARFTSEMINILRTLKREELVSYSASEIDPNGIIYGGTVEIKTGDKSIRIINKEMEIPWFKSENLSDKENIFAFYCDEKADSCNKISFSVQQKIKKVELITDFIKIPQEKYEIALDMALILTTNEHRYIISRGWYFDEELSVRIDENYDNIYPVNQVIEEWNNFGEWEVIVKRNTTVL